MAQHSESSGLHSLAELRARAEQRARQDASREAARIEAERRRVVDAEREQERALSARHRAEVAALESERDSALSRWQLLVTEHGARSRELEEERAARRSVELLATARGLRLQMLAIGLGTGAAGLMLALLAVYFLALRPAHARALSDGQRELALAEQASRESERARAVLSRRNAELEARLARPDARPEPKEPATKTKPPKIAGHGPRVATASPCRDDGDPLNPCLKR